MCSNRVIIFSYLFVQIGSHCLGLGLRPPKQSRLKGPTSKRLTPAQESSQQRSGRILEVDKKRKTLSRYYFNLFVWGGSHHPERPRMCKMAGTLREGNAELELAMLRRAGSVAWRISLATGKNVADFRMLASVVPRLPLKTLYERKNTSPQKSTHLRGLAPCVGETKYARKQACIYKT